MAAFILVLVIIILGSVLLIGSSIITKINASLNNQALIAGKLDELDLKFSRVDELLESRFGHDHE